MSIREIRLIDFPMISWRRLVTNMLNEHIWITPRMHFKNGRGDLQRKTLFLDLDGTLWPDQGHSAMGGRITIDPYWRTFLAKNRNYELVFVTNQTLFARLDNINLQLFLKYCINWIKLYWTLRPRAVLVCHHHPNSNSTFLRKNCAFRKPAIGLIDLYRKHFDFNEKYSIFVGDRITDMVFATKAGIVKRFIIHNDRMFETNVSQNSREPEYAIFSVINNLDFSFLEAENLKNV